MKIAWFTPFSTDSAIGRYSAAILDHLAREHEVTVFAAGMSKGRSLRPSLPTVRIDGRGESEAVAEQVDRHDVAVYNLGDYAPYHADVHRAMQRRSGVAIVHDVVNYGLFWGLSVRNGRHDHKSWLTELEYSHGADGRAWGERLLNGIDALGRGQEDVLKYTFLRSCVRGAVGVVTHGQWARRAVQAVTSAPVQPIEFPRFLGPDHPPPAPASNGRLRLLTFGAVNPNKASDVVLEAIAASERLRAGVEYTIAGGMGHKEYVAELRRLIARHRLEDAVRLVDRPDDPTLERLLAESDVVVNLRYPHLGECSGSLQEALLYGKPTVVWAHGYYDEFPDNVVVKVRSLEGLTVALEKLAADPAERAARAARSHEHAERRFQTPRYCRSLVAFLERCRSERPVCDWLDRLADRIADFPPDAALAARVAAEVAELASVPEARAEAA